MSWLKIDDGFMEHPKVVGLSASAFRLFMEGLCYSSRYLTDGKMPTGALRAMNGTPRAAVELVAAGLWEVRDEGWAVHDYLEYNPSRAEVDEKRQHISQERSKAGSKGAAKRWQGDGPVPLPVPLSSSETLSPQPPAAAPKDCLDRFFKAEKVNEQVAALVEMWHVPLSQQARGQLGAMLKKHGHGQDVANAAISAINARGSPVEYMQGVLRNGRQARRQDTRSGQGFSAEDADRAKRYLAGDDDALRDT